MTIFRSTRPLLLGCLILITGIAHAAEEPAPEKPAKAGYTQKEIFDRAETFFGNVTEGLARVIESAFAKHGRPNAIITGKEASGAIGIGARYGEGDLEPHGGEMRRIYWQGPSIGLDTGGNASKVMTLIYNLDDPEKMYQRFPGVDGSLYVIAGASVNYLRSGDLILAPIRSGIGARVGISVGYVHFTKKESWIPF